ncbi:MAG: glutaminase A [Planctomycetota bacterium]|jgi:glutaminase
MTKTNKTNGTPASQASRPHPRDRALFDALRSGDDETISAQALPGALARAGIRMDDPRLRDTAQILEGLEPGAPLDFETFRRAIGPGRLLIEHALTGRLALPEFEDFRNEVRRIFYATRTNREGAVADYIPQLARVAPEQYGVAVCTVDGQRESVGDADVEFCVQSGCKPVQYCLALEEHGQHHVHRHIGREPSGRMFNELSLNEDGLPHNPMINSGAIMASSLIRPDLALADRFDHVLQRWRELAGGHKPGFSNATYLSERLTADRNFALGHLMREQGGFPAGADLVETLEFYFQCCSLEMTASAVSVIAATLANGGISPVTGERVLQPETVQKCLSLMYSCGMYNFSGEWSFTIGLPAKSGVSGVIMVVVPNVAGFCTWSPRLDVNGNSVRGVEFFRELVRTYSFHNYDNLVGYAHQKKNPRVSVDQIRSDCVVELCWAASEGDLQGIRRLVARGVNLDEADYDGRTALHLAASEGHANVVDYFAAQGANLSPHDRWGATPLDDAIREGHDDVAELLRAKGAISSSAVPAAQPC